MSAMDEAKAALAELLENAKTGNIIPVRLPGQVEAIQELVLQAEAEHADAIKTLKNQPGGDAGEIMADNAEFMKTAIHELRIPMTSIRGYGDMLANPAMTGGLNEMQGQMLEVMRTNTKRMESLLSDMSYINKIRAGFLQINSKMDMFKNIALMAEKATRPLAEELDRQLEFDIPQGLPILTTDGEMFAQAMIKLIENGLRYSPQGEGKVTVSGGNADGALTVIIADNGIGITPEDQARLGELYFRADHDVVRDYKGSGLGIPIAFGLIEALDGTISLESQPDQGTRFTISIQGMS
jgi:signal transduction histidine kinase